MVAVLSPSPKRLSIGMRCTSTEDWNGGMINSPAATVAVTQLVMRVSPLVMMVQLVAMVLALSTGNPCQ